MVAASGSQAMAASVSSACSCKLVGQNLIYLPGLGHVRLSIIGVENGSQPISDETGDIQCVVNGEFYDFERIRAELTAKGSTFKTSSDSEILVHLYVTFSCSDSPLLMTLAATNITERTSFNIFEESSRLCSTTRFTRCSSLRATDSRSNLFIIRTPMGVFSWLASSKPSSLWDGRRSGMLIVLCTWAKPTTTVPSSKVF